MTHIIITLDDNTRVDIQLVTMSFSVVDQNLGRISEGHLVVKPMIACGLPLVLGTATGTVKFLGDIKAVVYK